MTKTYFLLPALLCAGMLLRAQTADTLLYENFNWDYDHTEDWELFPTGSETTFVNWDADGLTPNGSSALQFNWYWADFTNGTDTVPAQVLASKSWLVGFLTGNRNWFILPPLTIPNDSYTFHWKSAPYQMLRYMDGYTVLAAEGTNDVLQDAFTDTLFQAASMLAIVGNGQVQELSNFTFTDGYIHSNGLLLPEYFDSTISATLYYGNLEPHSVSLSAYSGKTMYFAFLHDSDDDNLMVLDDILITGSIGSGTNGAAVEDFRFVTFPNPVQNKLNVMFRLRESVAVSLQVADMSGRVVEQLMTSNTLSAGEHQQDYNLSRLPKGSYSITLAVDGLTMTKVLVKQ